MELVVLADLKSAALVRMGSSPASETKEFSMKKYIVF